MTGLERAHHLLRFSWVPGRFILQVREQEVRIGTPGVTAVSLYPALLQGYAMEYGLGAAAAESLLLADLSSGHTDPRYTRYAVHPVMLGATKNRLPTRIMTYSTRATKMQCLDLLADLIKEESATR